MNIDFSEFSYAVLLILQLKILIQESVPIADDLEFPVNETVFMVLDFHLTVCSK